MTLLIIFLCVAIGFSFYCSVAEAVLLSVTPSFIATLRDKKPADASRLEELKANIDRPLAAILSLNTIAHTIGAAWSGGAGCRDLGQWIAGHRQCCDDAVDPGAQRNYPQDNRSLALETLGPLRGQDRWGSDLDPVSAGVVK